MRHLVYALHSRGDATPAGVDGNILAIVTAATGGTLRTHIDAAGLHGSFRGTPGQEAWLESELVFTGEAMFQESGTISFGTGLHRLRFSTAGSGHLSPASGDGLRHGAVVYRIDGGDGQFAGATGSIASAFTVSNTGIVTHDQLGIVVIP